MNKRIRSSIIFLLAASPLAPGGCASGKKGGAAVVVVYNQGDVRECAFLGRVTQTATESEPAGEGMLRQRTAEAGGDTLLLLPGGIGAALDCGGPLPAVAP